MVLGLREVQLCAVFVLVCRLVASISAAVELRRDSMVRLCVPSTYVPMPHCHSREAADRRRLRAFHRG